MFSYPRLLPAFGAFPTPGRDISGARWQELMRNREIALFCFDQKTGKPLTISGKPPEIPIREYSLVFPGRVPARRRARTQIRAMPNMICALYDKRGHWLATFSRRGEEVRNPGLGLLLLILQFPALALVGTLSIVLGAAISSRVFGTAPIHWSQLDQREQVSLVVWGLFTAGLCRLAHVVAREALASWYGKPALQPLGSTGREKFYRRLARQKRRNLLVPDEISLIPTQITWPSPEKHSEWSEGLRRHGFELLGQYEIPTVRNFVEFWINPLKDLTASIVHVPSIGMWASAFTRYQDGSSFGVANKDAPGLDQHPTKKLIYLGPEAIIEDVIALSEKERPVGARHQPTPENVLPDYVKSWQEYIQWRRARGTTAQEFKNIDQRRAARKASQAL